MLRIKTGDLVFCVLEPANVRFMKEGKPLVVDLSKYGLRGTIAMYFTPDMKKLEEALEAKSEAKIVLTGEEIDKLIVGTLELQEVDRAAN